jgi:hypothetical protein
MRSGVYCGCAAVIVSVCESDQVGSFVPTVVRDHEGLTKDYTKILLSSYRLVSLFPLPPHLILILILLLLALSLNLSV